MNGTRVKLDENLGRSHAALLREAGYAVDTIHEEGLSGRTDEVVWQRVCAEGQFFITLDLGFSDVRRFGQGTHRGILLLRPRNRSREAVIDILSRVLRDHPLDTISGCLTVADALSTRIRRPGDSQH